MRRGLTFALIDNGVFFRFSDVASVLPLSGEQVLLSSTAYDAYMTGVSQRGAYSGVFNPLRATLRQALAKAPNGY